MAPVAGHGWGDRKGEKKDVLMTGGGQTSLELMSGRGAPCSQNRVHSLKGGVSLRKKPVGGGGNCNWVGKVERVAGGWGPLQNGGGVFRFGVRGGGGGRGVGVPLGDSWCSE